MLLVGEAKESMRTYTSGMMYTSGPTGRVGKWAECRKGMCCPPVCGPAEARQAGTWTCSERTNKKRRMYDLPRRDQTALSSARV